MNHHILVGYPADENLTRIKSFVEAMLQSRGNGNALMPEPTLRVEMIGSKVEIYFESPEPLETAAHIVEAWPSINWRFAQQVANGVCYSFATAGVFTSRTVLVIRSEFITNTHLRLTGNDDGRGGFLADLTFASNNSKSRKEVMSNVRAIAGRVYDLQGTLHIVFSKTPEIGALLQLSAAYPDLQFTVLGRVIS